jgi:hypothetical protein
MHVFLMVRSMAQPCVSNHEAETSASSFETPAVRATQDEGEQP